jgi:hypothetical protein
MEALARGILFAVVTCWFACRIVSLLEAAGVAWILVLRTIIEMLGPWRSFALTHVAGRRCRMVVVQWSRWGRRGGLGAGGTISISHFGKRRKQKIKIGW